MAKKLSFSDLDGKLSKISPLGSVITKNVFSQIDDWISTGNYMLNAQLSGSIFGGMPNSRSVTLAGEAGTGKTFLALNMCREAQKKGYEIIYCDSEAAVDRRQMENFGLDPGRVRYEPVNTVQQFSIFVNNLTKIVKDAKESDTEVPKLFIVLDSLGNLASSKEKEDMISGKQVRDMTKQQAIRSMFRTITMDLAELKIPLIVCNHTYDGIGLFAKKEISGGGGIMFNSSGIIMLSKAQLKETDKKIKETANQAEMKQTGIVVTSRIRKSRFSRPIPIKFHISFFKGMNKYTGLEKYITWDSCGIAKGDLLTEKQFEKLAKKKRDEYDIERYSWIHKTPIYETDEKTGKKKKVDEKEERLYFFPKESGRSIVVKHLGERLPQKELFTSKVLTMDVLKEIDEKEIKPLFKLPEVGIDDLDDIVTGIESTDDEFDKDDE